MCPLQENKDRIAAEVKKKNRLQAAAKRRSTATCSSLDREVKGMELESFLHNFASRHSSRRRVGRSPSNKGSPNSGSPNNGSLSEISSVGEAAAHGGSDSSAGVTQARRSDRADGTPPRLT